MKKFVSVFLLSFILVSEIAAQLPELPEGARTNWIIDDPEEIVGYLIFDPATVSDRLPSFLRFITVGELAENQIPWALDHLSQAPEHAGWGISFVEIVKMDRFEIDGKSPKWPQDGAAGLWAARIAASEPSQRFGPGRPLLLLDFWVPDSTYVNYMNEKGHYSEYGSVGLFEKEGSWKGSITAKKLQIDVQCTPVGDTVESAGSSGFQTLIPPNTSPVKDRVQISFAGHRIQECREDLPWKFRGSHPMTEGIILGTSTFQFGYDLIGGTYQIP